MHGLEPALAQARMVADGIAGLSPAVRVAICPAATLISRLAAALEGAPIEVGAQDCHAEATGAFTGDISAEMLADAGARLVILGHSERRGGHGETDDQVAAKVSAALRGGLEPIVCVGETLARRQAGQAVATVDAQLRGSLPSTLAGRPFAVAYEPIWAIGSGLTPTLTEIDQVHSAIRATLADLFGAQGAQATILYGGSVKPANAGEILARPEVNGALVGGASLAATDFLAIIAAA